VKTLFGNGEVEKLLFKVIRMPHFAIEMRFHKG
jgi:hypothetical protein